MLNHLKQFFWVNLPKYLYVENLCIPHHYLRVLITDTLLRSFMHELKEGNVNIIQELYNVDDVRHAALTIHLSQGVDRLMDTLGLKEALPADFSSNLVSQLLRDLVNPVDSESFVRVSQDGMTSYCNQ